ncbi:MAG: nicotinate-nucleotide adenylyltransferase [Planctomycetes bacterium]|nr:nicotinate-nucleotide adenylyltransferase [Planctomycetota bacterium]
MLGLLGGTFDPVHCGHLRMALEARDRFGLDEVVLMPAGAPRLRDPPRADGGARLRWLRKAVDGVDGLTVDDRELHRTGPTSTVDTLRELRRERPDDRLVLILGADAFARLARWTEWQAIPALAHLLVVRRPGARLPRRGPVAELVAERRGDEPRLLRRRRAGLVMVADLPLLDISATRVRDLLRSGRDARFLVPDAVLHMLISSGAYADDRN